MAEASKRPGTLPPTPRAADYDEGTEDLADALVSMWHACQGSGDNLPEALSVALAYAARSLAGSSAGADHDLTPRILVAQRPGSWEASLVTQLTYPLDLLSPGDPEDPRT